MRISENTRFPHPVLCEFTDDYTAGHFEFKIKDVEEITNTGQVTLTYEVDISEDAMEKLVEAGSARVGIFVICADTYFNKYMIVDISQSTISFPPGTLNDRVQVRSIISTVDDVIGFSSNNLHEEFGDRNLRFNKNEIIAVSEETVFTVGKEKLAPMETIFALSKDDTFEPGEISVITEADKITILACSETYTKISALRRNSAGRAVLLNAVYLPVVMKVLSEMKDTPDSTTDMRWYRIFSAKCTQLGINLDAPDVLSDAQKLLKSPFTKIETCKELCG